MVMTGFVPEMSTPKVSTILRLHTPSCMAQLERALFSLAGQRHGRIEPLILLQRFTPEDAEAVERMAVRLPWQAEADAPRVLNPADLPEGDQRAELLLRGIAAATGDFVGFLDYDDYLYPNAYEALLRRFETGGPAARGDQVTKGSDGTRSDKAGRAIAAAMGGVTISHERDEVPGGFIEFKRVMRQSRNHYLFFFENLYPIHSFLIQRSALDGIRLSVGMQALEDYHLLLQVLSKHPWDTELLGTPICEYVQRVSGTSTQQVTEADTAPHWQEARKEIAAWKCSHTASIPVDQVAQLARSHDRFFAMSQQGVTEDKTEDENETEETHVLPDAPLATPARNLLPLLALFRKRLGKVRVRLRQGLYLKIKGEIAPGNERHAPQVVLLYRNRRRLLLPRNRFVAAVYVSEPDAEGAYHYAATVHASSLGKIRAKDTFTAYAVCANRRIYRVGNSVRLSND